MIRSTRHSPHCPIMRFNAIEVLTPFRILFIDREYPL